MAHPLSLRFHDPDTLGQLKAVAAARSVSLSALAEQLIAEGLRTRRHPLIGFRDGPTGRRAVLVGGADVWEIVGGLVGGDVPADQRVDRAVHEFGLARHEVEAVLAYYVERTDEVDAEIAANAANADEAEDLWRRRRDLLAG